MEEFTEKLTNDIYLNEAVKNKLAPLVFKYTTDNVTTTVNNSCFKNDTNEYDKLDFHHH